MSIRQFKVRFAEDDEVLLLVDTSILTPEVATEINSFWGSPALRLSEENGGVVETVARMFGAAAIRHMQAEGGADFGKGDEEAAESWTRRVLELEAEGWPDVDGLGIRIVAAYVEVAGYYGVSFEEVTATD